VARIGTTRFRHDEWLYRASWSPDGKYIASSSGKTFIVWEANTGREVCREVLKDSDFPPADGKTREWPGFVEALEWSPDGGSILTVFNGSAQRWSWDGTQQRVRFAQADEIGPEHTPVVFAQFVGRRSQVLLA